MVGFPGQHLQINHRGLQAGVTQPALDRASVPPLQQTIHRERMPERVKNKRVEQIQGNANEFVE